MPLGPKVTKLFGFGAFGAELAELGPKRCQKCKSLGGSRLVHFAHCGHKCSVARVTLIPKLLQCMAHMLGLTWLTWLDAFGATTTALGANVWSKRQVPKEGPDFWFWHFWTFGCNVAPIIIACYQPHQKTSHSGSRDVGCWYRIKVYLKPYTTKTNFLMGVCS